MAHKSLPYVLIICGSIALWAAFTLTLDKITLLENPAAELPCNINPLVSCGPVILTPQASAFGVPNPMIGIAGYAFVISVGVMMIAGAIPNRRFWNLFLSGITFAEVFIHWLIFQSVYRIGNLCIYCMMTWAATWPIFIYTLSYMFPTSFIAKHKWPIIVGWYLLILLLIIARFRDFFFS